MFRISLIILDLQELSYKAEICRGGESIGQVFVPNDVARRMLSMCKGKCKKRVEEDFIYWYLGITVEIRVEDKSSDQFKEVKAQMTKLDALRVKKESKPFYESVKEHLKKFEEDPEYTYVNWIEDLKTIISEFEGKI